MSTTSWEEIKRLAADFPCSKRSCRKVRVGVPTKNLLILIILMSIPTKHNMDITNINFVFNLIASCERERGEKRQKK